MGDLLDTNFVSELGKARPNPLVVSYFLSRRPVDLFISVVSLAQIRFGIVKQANLARRMAFTAWLPDEIRPLFQGRTLPVTKAVMLRWRLLVADGRTRNHTYSQPDLLLAATALEHNLRLVTRNTRNTRDFADIPGLQLLNSWEPAA